MTSNDDTPIKQRLHITFGKFGALKYTGNLDVAKVWERVLRRAELPVLYTQGFNTRPRIALASALPLGITSECEILDVSLRESITLDGVIDQLTAVSPSGLKIYRVDDVPVRSPALQTLVRSAEYRIQFDDGLDVEGVQRQIDDVLSADKLIRTREKKGKIIETNLRPLIYDLVIEDATTIVAHLAVGDQGNVRPEDILKHLALADDFYRVHRYRLHLKPTDRDAGTP